LPWEFNKKTQENEKKKKKKRVEGEYSYFKTWGGLDFFSQTFFFLQTTAILLLILMMVDVADENGWTISQSP
jgi:hypothetical protein